MQKNKNKTQNSLFQLIGLYIKYIENNLDFNFLIYFNLNTNNNIHIKKLLTPKKDIET